jgi:hypothetical protein
MWHMRTQITFIILLGTLFSCNQKKQSKEIVEYEEDIESYSLDSIYSELLDYVNNPKYSDTICLNDINKAKRDLSNGRIIMNDYVGYDRGNRRYYNQLKQLCEELGIIFQPEGEYCVVYEGQTQGCYGLFMDSTIYAKYGRNFKIALHELADSLFFVEMSNDTIKRWFCDIQPSPNNGKRTVDEIYVKTDLNVISIRREWISQGDTMFAIDNPFMDIHFTVDKTGELSNFKLEYFVPASEHNERFKQELFNLGEQQIRERLPNWTPGTINGIPMNVEHNIRVQFKNSKAT